MNLGEAVLKSKLDPKGVETGVDRSVSAFDRMRAAGRRAVDGTKEKFKELKDSIFSIKGALAGLGLGALAKSFIDVGAEAQNTEVRLRVLLGSAEEGARAFEEMSKFAGTVPFQFREVMNSAANLAGILEGGVDEITQWMPLIGDLAAATGLGLEETTSQVQRMFSAGANSADLFRERGVLAMLGFQAGVAVSVEDTRKRLIEAWEEPTSQFRGATALLARTWDGTMSMLADAWFQFRKSVLLDTGLMDFLIALVGVITDELRAATQGGILDAENLGMTLINVFEGALAALDKFMDGMRFFGTVFEAFQASMSGFITIGLFAQLSQAEAQFDMVAQAAEDAARRANQLRVEGAAPEEIRAQQEYTLFVQGQLEEATNRRIRVEEAYNAQIDRQIQNNDALFASWDEFVAGSGNDFEGILERVKTKLAANNAETEKMERNARETAESIDRFGLETKATGDEIKFMATQAKEADDFLDAIDKTVLQLTKDYNPLAAAEIRRANALEALNNLHAIGKIVGNDYSIILANINKEYEDSINKAEQVALKTDEVAQIYRDAATNINNAFTDLFENLFDKGLDSFKDLAGDILDVFKRMIAQMLTLAIANPIIVPIVQGIGGALGLSAGAIGGVAGQFGAGAAGAGLAAGGLGGLLFSSGTAPTLLPGVGGLPALPGLASTGPTGLLAGFSGFGQGIGAGFSTFGSALAGGNGALAALGAWGAAIAGVMAIVSLFTDTPPPRIDVVNNLSQQYYGATGDPNFAPGGATGPDPRYFGVSPFGVTVVGRRITETFADQAGEAIDAVIDFDNLIFDRLNASQRAAVTAGLVPGGNTETISTFQGDDFTIEDILRDRLLNISGFIDPAIKEFVQRVGGSFEDQLQAFGEAIELSNIIDQTDLVDTFEDALRLSEQYAQGNETLLQTFNRIIAQTEALIDVFELLDVELPAAGDALIDFTNDFVEAAGGAARAAALWDSFFTSFFSPEEQLDARIGVQRGVVESELADIGRPDLTFETFRQAFEEALPTLSAEELAQWLEAGDALAVLNNLLGQLAPAIEETGEAVRTAIDDFFELTAGVRQSIDEIINGAIRDIEFGQLDTQGQFEFLTNEAEALAAMLPTLTDPAAVQAAIQEIDQLQRQAWSLLDETQRDQLADDFVDFLVGVREAGNSRISDLEGQELLDSGRRIGEGFADRVQPVIEKQVAAADKQVEAANKQVDAANTEKVVTVVVQSSENGFEEGGI